MSNLTETAKVTLADVAYAQFNRFNDTFNLSSYERVESEFLNAPADSADQIILKLKLSEHYFDEICRYPERDITRAIIDMVNRKEINNAIYYALAVVNDDTIEEYWTNPIKSAIADLERATLPVFEKPS